MFVPELKIENKLQRGDTVNLYVFQDRRKKETLSFQEDASDHYESPYQLTEGCIYEYEFESDKYQLLEDNDVINNSVSHSNTSRGTISTGIYVGRLNIDIIDTNTKSKVGKIYFEVRSIKADYRTDYQTMLGDITNCCVDLIMQQSSPVTQPFVVDSSSDPKTLYQRFAFVQSIVLSENFDNAINLIQNNPVSRWDDTIEEVSITHVRRINSSSIQQLARSNNRVHVNCSNIPFNTLPKSIQIPSKKDTTDIAENRFIKFALESFLAFCSMVHECDNAGARLKSESQLVCDKLNSYLAFPLFRNISQLRYLPLNSPVLQRKEGYREILQKWLMFDLAASLTWEGGDDVYEAGKRDVAVLYEYWIFFKLLDIFTKKFQIIPTEKDKLLSFDNNKLSLNLMQGKACIIDGTYKAHERLLHVSFCYNKTFSGTKDYERQGSWTSQMRPDYTLSIWPEGLHEDRNKAEEIAEKEDLITHIHFDAKYRIEHITFDYQDKLSDLKVQEEKGYYKRADMLKMHSYKDAIKRTAGAYILYPGTENSVITNYHEIIPGLGAFAISPKTYDESLKYFNKFIDDVIENFLDRTSQRERMAYEKYNVLQEPSVHLSIQYPEQIGENRGNFPSNTYVIVGYYKSKEHLEWCIKNKKYNVRIGAGTGSVKIIPELISAKYLLLYHEDDQIMFKITSKGPTIWSKQDLLRKQYPGKPTQDFYCMFDISQDIDMQFTSIKCGNKILSIFRNSTYTPTVVKMSEIFL